MDLKPTEYGSYEYPEWATYVGWMFSLASVSAIPFVIVLKICKAKGPLLQRIRILLEPTEEWGPKLQMHRMETHSPKHTDSQVPLALPNYDPDGYGENDFGESLGGSKMSVGDDSCSEFEGLRLNIPSRVSETGV
ncbi:transporter [Trichonephila clavipes]|nr:transporter [Trichonephila clavipes]